MTTTQFYIYDHILDTDERVVECKIIYIFCIFKYCIYTVLCTVILYSNIVYCLHIRMLYSHANLITMNTGSSKLFNIPYIIFGYSNRNNVSEYYSSETITYFRYWVFNHCVLYQFQLS